MNRPVIAVDCDDVLVPTAYNILAYYNHKYGTTIEPKDLYSDDDKVWGVDSNTAIERVNAYLNTVDYLGQEPFADAVAVIGELSDQYDLHVVTGRSDLLADATRLMLDTYFPGIFSSVEFTNFFTSKPRSKAAVCKQLGAQYLIDDHVHHANTVADSGIKVMLFGDYAWNQSAELHPDVIRVKDWYQILETLKK